MTRLLPEDGNTASRVRCLVLTYRRSQEATSTVRHLIEDEGFAPAHVLLVVNAEGGLEDQDLASQVPTVVLPENLGPAGGFHEGLARLAAEDDVDWVYVCEDDAGALNLPAPRVRDLVELAERRIREERTRLGAVVAYGRCLDHRTGLTRPHAPVPEGDRLQRTDVAAWGSTLVSAGPLREGILPDPDWFFGYEDFDFFLRLRERGYEVLIDRDAAMAVAHDKLHGYQPNAEVEPWRTYYATRNFLELRRRHGHVGWTITHLVKSVRRAQLASGRQGRRAIVAGLRDGFRGRMGLSDTGDWHP